jgi:hypothetical protein
MWWCIAKRTSGWCTGMVLKKIQVFYPIILTYKKLHGIFGINGNYLKANLLKSRDAKPEGAKVRKFDHVSRLLLFPYMKKI